MTVWIYRDPKVGDYDICSDYTDAVGRDFVEVDLPEQFIKEFSDCSLRFWGFQAHLESLWRHDRKESGPDDGQKGV